MSRKQRKTTRLWLSMHQWVGPKRSLFMTCTMFIGVLAVLSK